MSRQYKRYCKLIVAKDKTNNKAFDFSEYRIVFNIDQAFVARPCTAHIKVYNVPQSVVNEIKQEGQEIILDAGYVENHAVIFKGQLIQKYSGRENQTDTYLQIVASTGDLAHNFGVVNVSLKAGAKPEDVYNAIAKSYADKGIEKGSTPEFPVNALPRGKVMYKAAKEALIEFSNTHAMQWSYENNQLVCVPIRGVLPGDPLVINYKTGLLDMPVMTIGGLQVMMLLRPEIRALGTVLKLNNADIQYSPDSAAYADIASNEFKQRKYREDADGLYKVLSRVHTGDTRGSVWQTVVVCDGANSVLSSMDKTATNAVQN